MAVYKVAVKQMKVSRGIRIDKGMSVEVPTSSISNPVVTNGGQAVADAFMRVYGIDLKELGALNMVYLDVKRLS